MHISIKAYLNSLAASRSQKPPQSQVLLYQFCTMLFSLHYFHFVQGSKGLIHGSNTSQLMTSLSTYTLQVPPTPLQP